MGGASGWTAGSSEVLCDEATVIKTNCGVLAGWWDITDELGWSVNAASPATAEQSPPAPARPRHLCSSTTENF